MKKRFLPLFFLFFGVSALFAQQVKTDPATAEQEFRRGVLAYYRGSFNDSIHLFEKALTAMPSNPLILEWLGNAYYRSGVEGVALQHWQEALVSGYGGLLLKNKIELVKERRTEELFPNAIPSFSESVTFAAKTDDTWLFHNPLSLVSLPNGGFWATAYGSNELLQFDVNGLIVNKSRGPIEGFNRPFDVIRTASGDLLVSEFASDKITRLSPEGHFLRSFGSTGRGNGQCIGPQFLALDNYENVFVCDFGNARVVVFADDGKPLFTFGEPSDQFEGFIAPAGIAILHDLVYVADAIKGTIFVFDTAGNFLRKLLPDKSLLSIESLRVWNGKLLVASHNGASLVDISLASVTPIANLGNAPAKVTAAVPDVNGNLLLADVKNEKIEVLSTIRELAGGLFVSFERVYADKFPSVTVNVTVQNRDGTPLVGLDNSNFFLTEENRPVNNQELRGQVFDTSPCDISILIDRSPASQKEEKLIYTAIQEIAKAMPSDGTIHLISASDIPITEGSFSPSALASGTFTLSPTKGKQWKFDLGLRLAATKLINAHPKRAIIFLSLDALSTQDFAQYSLNDLAAFLNNNGIRFYVVNLKQGAISTEAEYLMHQTKGSMNYVYADRGLTPMITDIMRMPVGAYLLSYTSVLPTDFGRAYLPVEVEVRLLNRSGRDETGYFAPLE